MKTLEEIASQSTTVASGGQQELFAEAPKPGKKKGGRKTVDEEAKQTHTAKFRCTSTEDAWIKKQAEDAQMKPSDWLRRQVLTPSSPPVVVAFPAEVGPLVDEMNKVSKLSWKIHTILSARPDLYSKQQREGLLMELLVGVTDFRRSVTAVHTVVQEAILKARDVMAN